jgi:2-keto-4-pentenoate hydratase/2-oxohepta-3-ene-1,7-dioic acid hydratase in catechol pathway
LSVIRERVGGGIGRAGQRIRVEEAMGQLFGYTIVNGSLSDLIFDIPTLIATLSSVMTLETGDVIATGAPPGVGIGFTLLAISAPATWWRSLSTPLARSPTR